MLSTSSSGALPGAGWPGRVSDGAKIHLRQARIAGQLCDRALRRDATELHEDRSIGKTFDHMQRVLNDAYGLAGIPPKTDGNRTPADARARAGRRGAGGRGGGEGGGGAEKRGK